MKNLCATKTGARITTAVLLSAALSPAWAWDAGRMTGGGSLYCPAPIYRLTFGYELHCQLDSGQLSQPNNLEVNFASGDHFHLTSLDVADCSGPDTSRPNAPFTTLDGSGTGTLNGAPATITFQLVDNAEPGAGQDTAAFTITSGGTTYNCGPLPLEGGNNQAHRATGRKP
jgi:hypothetical protein